MSDLAKMVKYEKCITEVSHESDEVMHIAFGCDKNYAAPMGIVILSIMLHNPQEKILFHIFTADIDDADVQKLADMINMHNQSAKLYKFDPTILQTLYTFNQITYATYNRLVMAAYLYGKVKRVLYLDCDTLCLGQLGALYRMNLEGCIVLVAEDSETESKKQIRLLNLSHERYFNSGVMVIDLDRWNEHEISSNAINLRKKIVTQSGDQNVLNILLDGNTKYVSKIYNYFNDFRKLSSIPEETIIIHFVGTNKPWCAWVQYHPVAQLYFQYVSRSPWSDIPLIQPRNARDRKWIFKSYRRRGQYGQAIAWYFRYIYWKLKS